MRTLKFAVLGILSLKPMNEEEIGQIISQDIGCFWSTKHIQVIPEINRLTKEGLITKNPDGYNITHKGSAELDQWLVKDQALDNTAKDIFSLRMYFSHRMDDERICELLQSQKIQHEAKQKFLQVILRQKYKSGHPSHEERGYYLLLKGSIERETFYVKWLNECLDYIQEETKGQD